MAYSQLDRVTKDQYTLSEIERALKFEPLMYAYAEAGDLDVIHLLIDSRKALELANPTEIQLKTIDLVWRQGYSLVETGKRLGVTPQAVKFNIDLLKVKIKKVLDEWVIQERGELTNVVSE